MKNDYFTNLSATLINDLLSQAELTPKSPIAIMEYLLSQAELVSKSPMAVMSALLSQAELVSNAINALPESASYQGSFDFLKRINIQEDFIELTENDCDTINTLLESSDAPHPPTKISKGKMAVTEFIKAVLIPILAFLLPMMQNAYYNKITSLESKNQQIQEQEYCEQILQSLTDFQNSLTAIQEAQESCSCNHSAVPALQDEELTDTSCEQYQADTAE